ncbi:Uncharacterized protein Fot_32837 [Forsythia ovata]|uniref:Uncharacterized protein n=1 Tax=Forsythia ovata TaxID=205694 RepID=A0ABD1T8Y9_9LAMI
MKVSLKEAKMWATPKTSSPSLVAGPRRNSEEGEWQGNGGGGGFFTDVGGGSGVRGAGVGRDETEAVCFMGEVVSTEEEEEESGEEGSRENGDGDDDNDELMRNGLVGM